MNKSVIAQEQIDSDAVRRTIRFHDHLNAKLWDKNHQMRLEVRIRLLRAALAFYRFLDLPGLAVADIVVTGSNAAFNYTDSSDIDVHLIVDYDRTTCPELAENFFTAKKSLWNQNHDVTIRGHQIEMYVEDTRTPAHSNGVYSLLRGWRNQPSPTAPAWNDAAVIQKANHLADEIDALLSGSPTAENIDALTRRLRTMRQSGLADGGEFSVENLVYKGLRALGYIDRLYTAKTKLEDLDISLR